MNKDSITKKLFEDKEIFASFINGVIYQGKKILSSHHLKEINISTISDSFKERIRDIVQVYQTGDKIFALYHIESQSVMDFSMVFRMMEYQAELYLKKFKENHRHREKLPPIISVVFYTGKEEWKQYRSLYECVQLSREIEFDNMDLNFFVWGLKYSYQDKWEYLMTKFKNKIIKRGTMKMLLEMCGQKEELKDMEERVEVAHELGSYQRRMINQGIEQGIHQGECKIIKTLFQTMSIEEISSAIQKPIEDIKRILESR